MDWNKYFYCWDFFCICVYRFNIYLILDCYFIIYCIINVLWILIKLFNCFIFKYLEQIKVKVYLLVIIIVICYNYKKYVVEMLDSICN